MATEIKDFGEKISGAKKDLWVKRGGMTVSDLDSVTDRELLKLVTKDYIFPVPDYIDLVENKGMEPACAYYIHEIRSKCGAKLPQKATREDAQRFIMFLTDVKEVCLTTLTVRDARNFFTRLFRERGYYKDGYPGWTDKAKNIACLNNKITKFVQIGMWDYKWEPFEKECELQGFPYSYDAAYKGSYIHDFEGKGFCIVQKGGRIVSDFFSSKEALLGKLKEKKEEAAKEPKKDTSKGGSKQIVRPQLAHIQRTGPDVRAGKDVTGEDILKVFNFRGGQFGNWNNDADRQACLNYSYDALYDLAYALDIPLTAIATMGGEDKLGIAYGARGRGNAAAHYEPILNVLNLTKKRGAGCTAHELGHAYDEVFGKMCNAGKCLSTAGSIPAAKLQNPALYHAFQKVKDAIFYRAKELGDKETDLINALDRPRRNLEIVIKNAFYYFAKQSGRSRAATPEEVQEYEKLLLAILYNPTTELLDQLFELYKTVKGHVVPKAARTDIINRAVYYQSGLRRLLEFKANPTVESTDRTYTNFYRGAEHLDKNSSKPYFTLKDEMFARAFETYVHDVLPYKSQYLVHSVHNSHYADKAPYPAGEERERIVEAFKDFFKVVKSEIFNNKGFVPNTDTAIVPKAENPAAPATQPTQPTQAPTETPPVEAKTTTKDKAQYQVRTLAELRSLIGHLPSFVPPDKDYNTLTHIRKLRTRLGTHNIQVVKGEINTVDCGRLKSYTFKDGVVTLGSSETPEKQLQGLIECYVRTVGQKIGGRHATHTGLLEAGIYALCKNMGLDVRIYCKSEALFNQFLNNPGTCEQFITMTKEYLK